MEKYDFSDTDVFEKDNLSIDYLDLDVKIQFVNSLYKKIYGDNVKYMASCGLNVLIF